MKKFANMKIGKKITYILGGIIFLLVSMSALSLWGVRTNEKLGADGQPAAHQSSAGGRGRRYRRPRLRVVWEP